MKTEFADKYITLGLKIAYYRKKAGYTQETFAELIDKSVNFVGQVEGTGTVGTEFFHRIFRPYIVEFKSRYSYAAAFKRHNQSP